MPPKRQRVPPDVADGTGTSTEPDSNQTATVPKPKFTNPKTGSLYDLLVSQTTSTAKTYTQSDLEALHVATSEQELLLICQELLNRGLFQPLTLSDGTTCYRLKSHSDASKIQALDSDARIIYSTIEGAGTAGIWTKTLKSKTNLHQTVLTRALKMLENKNYVKQIRNAKYPGRKIYMLKNLNPTEEVTGGPWYSDGELDQELIKITSDWILIYVEMESWKVGDKIRKVSKAGNRSIDDVLATEMVNDRGHVLTPHPTDYNEYPTPSDILNFIVGRGIIKGKEIEPSDLQTLIDVLVFDRKLEIVRPITSSKAGSKRKRQTQDMRQTEPGKQNADADPHAAKRRKMLSKTVLADSSDSSDDETNPDYERDATSTKLADTIPEQMYRTVRHTGYPPPPMHTAAASSTTDKDKSDASKPDALPTPAPAPPPRRNAFAETPCCRCPVFRLCADGGPVDARSCGYFDGWLAAEAVDIAAVAPGVASAAAAARAEGNVKGAPAVVVEITSPPAG